MIVLDNVVVTSLLCMQCNHFKWADEISGPSSARKQQAVGDQVPQMASSVQCGCGVAAVLRTSQSQTNPGRQYYSCHKGKTNGPCSFFKWADEVAAAAGGCCCSADRLDGAWMRSHSPGMHKELAGHLHHMQFCWHRLVNVDVQQLTRTCSPGAPIRDASSSCHVTSHVFTHSTPHAPYGITLPASHVALHCQHHMQH